MINDRPEPPRFWTSFLRWFCPAELCEGIEGDLLEQFESDVEMKGLRVARRRFIWHVVSFFRPDILLRRQFSNSISELCGMVDLTKMYLRIGWRNLFRYKAVSMINIVGLAVSLSVGLLILLVIKNRMDFDSFHPDSDRLFHITTRVQERSGDHVHFATSAASLGPYLKEHFGFVEEILRVRPTLRGDVITDNGEIRLTGAYVDDSFLRVLGFKLLGGNARRALSDPYSIVLTEKTAVKIFGRATPLGRVIKLQGHGEFKVTGIIMEPDKPSQLEFEAYASMSTLMPPNKSATISPKDWGSYYQDYTYLKILPGTEEAMVRSLRGVSENISTLPAIQKTFFFQADNIGAIPVSDIMFGKGHSVQSLMTLSIPGVILLLVAVFNYGNMTIARAFSRSREVGVRKINGALRYQLFFQLIVESVLVAVIATFLSAPIALHIPVNESFQQQLPKTIDPTVILWFFSFAIATGLLAGALPAWKLSGIKTIDALRKNASVTGKLTWRKGIIVVQYTLSIAFLVVLLVNYRQMRFQIESDYGFQRNGIIHVKTGDVRSDLLATKIRTIPEVESVSASSTPIFTWGNQSRIRSDSDSAKIEYYSVDDAYLPVYGLALVAGDNLPPGQREEFILLNERAISVLGLGSPIEAVGRRVTVDDTLSLQVRGVVKDFNAHPFKFAIAPLALRYRPGDFAVLNVKVHPSALPEAMEKISLAWDELKPDQPLSYTVFADSFNERQAHKQDLYMMTSLAVLSIIVCCLGLLGVVMYRTQMRLKEIGIRKAMGAFSHQIMALLSWSFLKLLFISSGLAIPLGYWFGNLLLQQFVYRVDLGPETGLLAFAMIMTISLVTIGSQTIRAGLRNPVEILRHE